jgi:hypothetical protein
MVIINHNQMKQISIALALLFFNVIIAQNTPTSLEATIKTGDIPCDKDFTEKIVTLEQVEGDQKKDIGTFPSTGCEFKIQKILASGNYVLTISGLTIENEIINFTVTEENRARIVLNLITLRLKSTELSEVTVYASQKQYIKVEADKTTVNVKDNALLNSGSSYDAVKRLPGVISSPTGSLSLNGRGVRIYIDGAPSTLSGTDLQNYLSSLPANAIEKVELIYNPGASFDANSSGSVINIVTSSKRLKGINASFNINYNFNQYQKPSPQILLNGKEKDLSWQTMIGFNYIEGENNTSTDQTFTSFDPDEVLRQRNLTVSINRNVYFRLGTNYRLSKKSNLLFNYNANVANDYNVFDATTQGTGINYFNKGTSKNKNNNHEVSLQYKTKLDTIGSTLDVTAFGNTFGRKPITNSSAIDKISNTTFLNNGDIDFNLTNYYLKYDFTFPLKKLKLSVNTGGKFNSIKVQNTGIYTIGNNNNSSKIDFDYDESNLAFYVEARKTIKKFSFTAGLRFEDFNVERITNTTTGTITFRNTRFFPTINANYALTGDINVSGSYSKKISQPSYDVLDPNNGASFDQYNTSQGNPFLKPIFFDNYEFKISAFQFVQLGVNYTASKNNNLFIYNAAPGELVSNQTTQQFDEFTTFSAFVSFPIPLDYFLKGKEEFQKRMSNIDQMNYIFLNINYVKSDIEGYIFPYTNKAITNYAAQSQIILPWNIKNSMSYFILPTGTWQIYNITKPIQQFDISFNRDFMKGKLKMGLHCFDVFNSNEVNALIAGNNLNTNFRQKQDSRTFRVSLTYNFGNLKLEKENTNINTEKVNSGGGLLK